MQRQSTLLKHITKLFNLPQAIEFAPPNSSPTPNFHEPSASIKQPLPNKDVFMYMIMGDRAVKLSARSLYNQ